MHATEIPWGRGGLATVAPWPDTQPIVAAALASLPDVTDDDTAAVVEHLAHAVADREAELLAVRVILSAALAEAHNLGVELHRVRERYHALLDARRAERAREAA